MPQPESKTLSAKQYVRREFRLQPIAMQPWDYVKWDWTVEQGWSARALDLGFRVEFRTDAQSPPQIMSQQIRMTNMNSDFIAESPGLLTLVWNNEHSWFYNKTLHYDVQLPCNDLGDAVAEEAQKIALQEGGNAAAAPSAGAAAPTLAATPASPSCPCCPA